MTNLLTRKGAKVLYAGETMRIVGATGFDTLVVQSKDGQYLHAPVEALIEDAAAPKIRTTVKVDQRRLEKVNAYKAAFSPLLSAKCRKTEDVRAAGKAVGIGLTASYAVLARFDASGDINDLPPMTRSGGRGKSRLPASAEQIIQQNIETILLTRRQHRLKLFLQKTLSALAKAGFQVSEATLRNRVANIDPHLWTKKRQGYDAAKKARDPHRGSAPQGGRPLEIIQCDHWKTDVEILADDRLTVIGRAWLTLAIDVYSRAVWGWHLGLDSPGTIPTAFCMIRGITRKDGVLKSHGLCAQMPFFGMPEALYLDNAGEFRGRTMQAACKFFGIKLQWRPVESPQFGAHIERLNGTLAGKFKDLPGATGATPTERKALRPEVTAALTFEDLSKQILMIFDEYHNTAHAGIGGMTPLAKWTEYYFGPEGQRRPTPAIVLDDLALRIQWYPLEKRSLQRYGIRIDFLDYYSEDLEHLVRNRTPGERFDVRRNPLDVREIYFLHPQREEWLIIPCRYLRFPVSTMMELREAAREAHRLKRAPTSEALAQIIEERHQHAAEAVKKTKSAARAATAKANNDKMRRKAPKTFTDFAEDDRIEILSPQDKDFGLARPRDTKARAVRDSQQPNRESFAGQAAAIDGMSDDEIDRYLDD